MLGAKKFPERRLLSTIVRYSFFALRVSPHMRVYFGVHNISADTWLKGFPLCWDVTALSLFSALSSLDGVIMESEISISFCGVIRMYGTVLLIEVSKFGYLGR